jgi:putative intracellular protease/amidase
MNDRVLAGRKIAVLVENQYIPWEIQTYQQRFAEHGATVDLMTRLWPNEKNQPGDGPDKYPPLTFVSEVEEPGKTPKTLTVNIDFRTVNLADYAAVIMAANVTSVRLRWNEESTTSSNPGQAVRNAPAVHFFRNAMFNRNIVKGAPCHALWILAAAPDVIAGRRVTCNPVVLADVLNTGATYVPAPSTENWAQHIVVDDDLVTSMSSHDAPTVALFVDTVKDAIVARPAQPGATAQPATAVTPRGARRRILIALSEWGYWGEELVGPLGEFDRVGYQVDFMTPTGKRPNAITVSMDPDFFDPPLQRPVTTPEMAARVREIDDPSTDQGRRIENPINLSAWFPERPYFAAPAFVRALEAYNHALEQAVRGIEKYDALLIVGGSGPIVDLANNQRIHDLILAFLRAGKPIAAECYGVTCLAFARDMNERRSIIWGKHVTGHCLEYDYKDGTAFMRARGEFLDFNMGPPPYPLEFILSDATGPDGGYHGNFGEPTSVIVDYPFITGRSTPDSILTGQKVVEVLDGNPPLRRWGW